MGRLFSAVVALRAPAQNDLSRIDLKIGLAALGDGVTAKAEARKETTTARAGENAGLHAG